MSRTLLDHSVPRGLRAFLTGFDVKHAFEMGWYELKNGDLLAAAEHAGFAIVITADKNIRYQQSRAGRRIAIVQLSTNHWPLERHGRGSWRHCRASAPEHSARSRCRAQC